MADLVVGEGLLEEVETRDEDLLHRRAVALLHALGEPWALPFQIWNTSNFHIPEI